MAATLSASNASAQDMLAAAIARLNLGSGAALLRIYAGTEPADATASLGAAVLLSQHTMSDPAFGGTSDDNPGAIATASAIADDTVADNTGIASFFRCYQSDGTTSEIQGNVGATIGQFTLVIDNVNIQAGVTVKILSLVARHPE